MTTWEALAMVVGREWADKLWITVRWRDGLLDEIAQIAPRWIVRMRSDGSRELWDSAAADRAAWISSAAAEHAHGMALDV